MTQLYANTSNTKKAKSSKIDFLLDFEKAADFSAAFLFLMDGGAVLANLTIGFEQKTYVCGQMDYRHLFGGAALSASSTKKGTRKIGPLFYWYVPNLFAVAHEL